MTIPCDVKDVEHRPLAVTGGININSDNHFEKVFGH